MKRKKVLSAALIAASILFLYGAGEVSYRMYHKFTTLNNEVAGLYEVLAMNDTPKIDTLPHHVLCLGNSITRHVPKADIGWHSDWGMAASCIEKDYCHQLQDMLKERNKASTVSPLNIAYWERNLECSIDSLIQDSLKGKDIVIIRLGENVQDKNLFQTKILDLVNACKKQTPNIIITGCFWEDGKKEISLIRAAYINHLKYVPLYWISRNHKDEAYPTPTDQIMDMKGNTYTLTEKGVLNHPGDEGMRMIAESIFNAL